MPRSICFEALCAGHAVRYADWRCQLLPVQRPIGHRMGRIATLQAPLGKFNPGLPDFFGIPGNSSGAAAGTLAVATGSTNACWQCRHVNSVTRPPQLASGRDNHEMALLLPLLNKHVALINSDHCRLCRVNLLAVEPDAALSERAAGVTLGRRHS